MMANDAVQQKTGASYTKNSYQKLKTIVLSKDGSFVSTHKNLKSFQCPADISAC